MNLDRQLDRQAWAVYIGSVAKEHGAGPALYAAKSEDPEAGYAEYAIEQAKRRKALSEPTGDG